MANTNKVRGLWPLRHLSGGEIRNNAYILKTGQTVYQGDILSVDATGTVLAATAADSVKIIGVAAEYVSDSGSVGGKVVRVYDDPFIVFGCQIDATGSAPTAADVFMCANHIAGAGNATTKQSGHQWNQNSINTTALDLKLLGLIDMPNNEWGSYAQVEVILNSHVLKGVGPAGI